MASPLQIRQRDRQFDEGRYRHRDTELDKIEEIVHELKVQPEPDLTAGLWFGMLSVFVRRRGAVGVHGHPAVVRAGNQPFRGGVLILVV